MCTRRSAVCKKLLAALLAVTTTLGLFGCGGNEEAPKEDKAAEPATEKEPSGTDYLPVEMMSREETKQLTAGTVIEVDDLKAMPDERVLDDLDLAVVYRYHNIETSEDGSENEYDHKMAQPIDLSADGTETTTLSDFTVFMEFTGIEIVSIDHFDLNDEGQYEKIVKIDENLYESAGPVLSEDKISKLNGN